MWCSLSPLLLICLPVQVAVASVASQGRHKYFLQPSPAPVALLQEESFSQSGAQMRLEAGSHVRLKGLKSAVDLNGRQGMIQAYDPYSGRYIITMTGGGASKRIRPDNVELLELSEINDDPVADGERFHHGTKVVLHGLHALRALNGKVGIIRHFDFGSGRYIVEIKGQPPKRIKPENLQSADGESLSASMQGRAEGGAPGAGAGQSSICQTSDDPGPNGWSKGMKLQLHGLRSATASPWNGLIGVVHCFDQSSQRYVVALPDGTPRKIKPANLEALDGGDPPQEARQGGSDQDGDQEGNRGSGDQDGGSNPAGGDPGAGDFAEGGSAEGGDPIGAISGGISAMISGGDPGREQPTRANSAQPDKSICKEKWEEQASRGFKGPGGFSIGMKVVLHDLHSPAALVGNWNGMVGTIHCFDTDSGRYVVQCPDKVPRKLKAANLMSANAAANAANKGKPETSGSICQQQASSKTHLPGGIKIGAKVRLHGLKSAAALKGGWNGMVGVVHCFLTEAQRFVVLCADKMPRKLKLANLQQVGAARPASAASADASEQDSEDPPQPDSEGAPQPGAPSAKSVCQAQLSQGVTSVGPGGLAIGTKVALFGLTSKAAVIGHWNGMVGVVHCFDSSSQRYVVAVADGHPRKIKIENLAIITTAVTPTANHNQTATNSTNKTASGGATPKQVHWMKGAYVRIFGLKSAAELNGQVANVIDYDNTTERYTLKIQGMNRLKKIRASNLKDVSTSAPTLAPVVMAAVSDDVGAAAPIVNIGGASAPIAKQASGHQVSVCNAYATHSPIQVFAVSSDGKHYTHVVKNLDFQSCSDVDDLAADQVKSLIYIVGKFQIAKKAIDLSVLSPGQGLELVVFRKDQNSLQATVHENPVEIGDNEAYYLHIVNAYAGRKNLELHVQRGKFLKKLPLDRTFRLSTAKAINMVLSDGSQKLRLAFQPRLAKTYCIMTTGVDEGLRGEPRNVGLVAHEIGTWTSSEEMMNAETNVQSPGESLLQYTQAGDSDTEDTHDETVASAGTGSLHAVESVLGSFFGGAGRKVS